MSTTAVALAWAVVVTLAALSCPRPRGVRRSSERSRPQRTRPQRTQPQRTQPLRAMLGSVGLAVASVVARVAGRPPPVLAHPAALGGGLLLGGFLVASAPSSWPLAIVLGILPPLVARTSRAQARTAAGRALLDELPEVIDLLGLAIGAGLTAPLAVAAVGRRGGGGLAAAMAQATRTAAQDGRRLADVLDDIPATLGPSGDGVRPLLGALADAARHGTALGPSLERLAAEARTARRHRAEERARRVPILLLFPLVTCTLPALGLLTIAPLAIGALRDLRA